jgi:hypothetical protein
MDNFKVAALFAFSYLANGVAGKHGAARALIDQLVDALAQHLYVR